MNVGVFVHFYLSHTDQEHLAILAMLKSAYVGHFELYYQTLRRNKGTNQCTKRILENETTAYRQTVSQLH